MAVLELLLKIVGMLAIVRPERRIAFSNFVEYAFAIQVAVLLVFVIAFNVAAWGKGVPVGADAHYITFEGWWNVIGYTLSGGFFFTVTVAQRIVMGAYVVALPLTYLYSGFAIDTAFGRREPRWDAANSRSASVVPMTVLMAVFFWFGVTAARTLFEGFAKDRTPPKPDLVLNISTCLLVAPGTADRHIHAEGVITNHSQDGQIVDLTALLLPDPVLRYLGGAAPADPMADGVKIAPSSAGLAESAEPALVQPGAAAMARFDFPLTERQENAILQTRYHPDCNLSVPDQLFLIVTSVGLDIPQGVSAKFEDGPGDGRAPMTD